MMMILPKGTFLFRTTFKSYLEPVKDEDTGKIGLYFSNYPILALSMCLEYDSNMIYNIYKSTKNIELYEGKYSFRNINKKRFFTEDGNFIANVDTLEDEMINHFDNEAYPLIDNEFEFDPNLGEIFLNSESLNNIELVRSYNLSKDYLKEQIKIYGINSTYNYNFEY